MDETTAPAPTPARPAHGGASVCPDNVPAIALRAIALAIVDGDLRATPAVVAKLRELAARAGIAEGPAAIVAAVRRAARA